MHRVTKGKGTSKIKHAVREVTAEVTTVTAHLPIPAQHPQFLPLLPFSKVIRVHGLLRGVPAVQHPLWGLQRQKQSSVI